MNKLALSRTSGVARLCVGLSLLVMVVQLVGCPPPDIRVSVTPSAASIAVEETVTLAATSTSTADTMFTWTSANQAVATVDSNGLVTGVSVGSARINATGNSSGKKGSATVTVTGPTLDLQAALLDASFSDPLDPDDAGWGGRTQKQANLIVRTSSGSPLLGGHGATGTVAKSIQIQAAYDAEYVYLHMLWPDSTANETDRAWSFDGESWSRSADEDRVYVSWPIVDGPGREGKTFEQIGCAMMCHQQEINNGLLLANTVAPVNDCSLCHVNVAGNTVNNTPPFQHALLNGLDCTVCHGNGPRPDVVTDGVTFDFADMIAPLDTAFDIWHWKAQRSNPLGVAEDQFTANGAPRSRDGSNLAPDNTAANAAGNNIPRYIWVDAGAHASGSAFPMFRSQIDALSSEIATWNADTQQYERLSDATVVTPAAGDTVSRHILRDDLVEADDSANVLANGVYDQASQTWALVLARKFASGDARTETDVDFDVMGVVPFSLAVTDNSGVIHHGVAGPIRLGFEPAP